MSYINSIIMGILYGITEFLPFSGTGHIAVYCSLFGMDVQSGTVYFFRFLLDIASLLVLSFTFSVDLKKMINGTVSAITGVADKSDSSGFFAGRLLLLVLLASIPGLFMMIILNNIRYLFTLQAFVGAMFIINGTAIFVSDKFNIGTRTEKSISFVDALLIGIVNCICYIPGISRMGILYSTGLCLNLKKPFSLKFCYLVSIPAALISAICNLSASIHFGFEVSGLGSMLFGMIAAIISGFTAINIMIKIVKSKNMSGCAYYCWVAGVISVILSVIF